MGAVTQEVTNSQTVTITIASLANNTAVASSAIDNSTNKFLEALVYIKVKSNAAGTSAVGLVNVFVVRSPDGGTTYDDTTRTLIGTIPLTANATTVSGVFSTAPTGALGTHWKVSIENRSGAALDATGGSHAASFAGVKYNVA